MRELTCADFAASEPQPLGEDVHVWFFPRWHAPPGGATAAPVLRDLFAHYVGTAPAELAIERGAQGKPHLIGAGIQFNLSHSGDALLVGISRSQALGVDIETPRRARPVLELARRFFAASETAVLQALAPAQQASAFLWLWSGKEAVLKALGLGISFGLHRVAFSLDAQGCPVALVSDDALLQPTSDWQLLRLRPAADYIGTLAWRGPPRHVRGFTASAT